MPADAYVWSSCAWPSGVRNGGIPFYHYDIAGYVTLTGNSAGRWNAVVARADLFPVSSGSEASVRATEDNLGSGSGTGITYTTCSSGFLTSAISELNTYYDRGDNGQRYNTMVHELGHALSLGHTPTGLPCNQTSIMHPTTASYVNCGIQYPTADDAKGVNDRY